MTKKCIEKIEGRLAELEAREHIRSVLYAYCRAVDRGDLELMKSCYHADGRDDHGFFSGTGWDFAEYVLPILAQLDRCIHSLSNPIIELNGNQAFVETHWSVIHRIERWSKLTDMWHQGRYLDVFERRDGQWKISERVSILDAERWIDTVDMQLLVSEKSTQKPFRGTRGPEDFVYQQYNIRKLVRKDYSIPALWEPIRRTLIFPKMLLHCFARFQQRKNSRQPNIYA